MKVARTSLAFCLIALGLAMVPNAPAVAVTVWSYPGSAPCDTTLQACVDAASAGDVIEVVADVADPGNVTITKSISIVGTTTARPVLGTTGQARSITINSEDPTDTTQVNVSIRGLDLRDIRVSAYYPKGTGSSFEVGDDLISYDHGSNGDVAIDMTAYAPITTSIHDNVVDSDGYGLKLYALEGGTAGFGVATPGTGEYRIERNTFTTSSPVDSSGNELVLNPSMGSATHVRFFDNVVDGVAGCFCGGASGLDLVATTAGAVTVDIWHNTIVHTAKGGNGPSVGIAIEQQSSGAPRVNLFDNVVAYTRGQGISISGGPTVVSGWNDWYANSRKDRWAGIPHPHELTVDPRFVDPASDYRLRATSPLVDAGQVCRPGGLGTLDAAHRLRLAGSAVDVGAREHGATKSALEGGVWMGTPVADTFTGTRHQDFLCGARGDDTLTGGADDDYLNGGPGVDQLDGGGGADVLDARDGKPGDTVNGGTGSDVCLVDKGDVTISC